LLLIVLPFTVFVPCAQAVSKRIGIHVRVFPYLHIHTRYQKPDLVITNKDIRRGYKEIKAGTRYFIQTNVRGQYELVFSSLPHVFKKVLVSDSSGTEYEVNNDGCVYMTYAGGRAGEEKTLNYLFYLDDHVRPGTYRWPMAMTFDVQ